MLIATLVLAFMGLALGAGLGVAARRFAVEGGNPLIKEVEAMMPGSQCGQCGFPGCSSAAAAMVEGDAPLGCCPPGGVALAEQVAALLGVTLDAGAVSAPKQAAIKAEQCTGCTRCYRACPTDAIVGASGQIHVVLQDACTGCSKCADACPEDCISLSTQEPTLDRWHWDKPQAA